MAIYKHGTYGEFAESVGQVAAQSGTVAVYVGIAPVNLIRGYAARVNAPVKLASMADVRQFMGYSKDWGSYDLCEAFKLHFDNDAGNVGPIVAINVLDPAQHRKVEATTKALSFVNGRATIDSDTIVLDTLVLADKVENTDYTVDYDFNKGQVIIQSIGTNAITGSVDATYYEVDVTAIDADDVIGSATDAGVYTGLGCVALVHQELNVIPNLIICPKWSEQPTVYKAMVETATKINGHWDAFVYADIPVVDGTKVDTIALAQKWKADNAYTNERSKVFWPKAKSTDGTIYHASVLAAWRTILVDASHNGIPMESPSNKTVPVAKQYFGEGSTNRGFDQQTANKLNEDGITTIVYWGGQWVLWGPHTAAYKHDAVSDNRNIFDNSIRMMMHVSNSFQMEHALTIDSPMTIAMSDTIRNREQEKMDALAAMGAFIGTPVVEFRRSDNSASELVEGNFVWYFKGTPAPPFKSGTLKVAYTTAGFDSYFEEVA